jgi:hypothetical protein
MKKLVEDATHEPEIVPRDAPEMRSVAVADVKPTSASCRVKERELFSQLMTTILISTAALPPLRGRQLTDNSRAIREGTGPDIVVVGVPALQRDSLAKRVLLCEYQSTTLLDQRGNPLTLRAMMRGFFRMAKAAEETVERSVEMSSGDLHPRVSHQALGASI